jgi:TRAP transporter 4TM/12TM fusion protein
MRGKITRILVIAFSLLISLFILYTTVFGEYTAMVQRGIPLLLSTTIIFLMKPFKKDKPLSLLEILFILGIWFSAGYIILYYEEIANRIGITTTLDTVTSIIGTIVVLEMTRRMTGLIIPVIAIVFLLYSFWGGFIPGLLGHGGFSLDRVARYMWLSGDGVFGTPTEVVVSYIIIFVIFAAFLENSGTGNFFIRLSYAITGRLRSGPAQCAVVASSLFGTISGSAVANVAGTGVFTIPLMKKAGYEPKFAGAVEAVASTGGQIMPPIMGAGAFILAEITGIPYIRVCAMAIIPALLYYFGVAMAVHFEAVRKGLKPVAKEDVPNLFVVLKEGWFFLIPIVTLIVLLIIGYTPGRCAFFAILASIVIGVIRKNLGFSEIFKTLAQGAQMSLQLVSLCACVGVIVGAITMSGIGVKFSEFVILLSGGKLFLALIFNMIASIILGMGVPTVAAYLLLVVVTAPTLVQLGISLFSAHFFVYYFGCLSAITPPVAMAAYTGAGIAGSGPMETGLTASKIGLVAFIVPFIFAYNPIFLLEGSLIDLFIAIPTAIIGIIILSMSTIGCGLRNKYSYFERIILLASAILLIKPGLYTDLAGLALFALVLTYKKFFRQ